MNTMENNEHKCNYTKINAVLTRYFLLYKSPAIDIIIITVHTVPRFIIIDFSSVFGIWHWAKVINGTQVHNKVCNVLL
jgi:hypothetical protein